ncbi:hypothetical protein DYB34_003004 [Aphanomyces astaci]|uniref:EF-hand domain-containing protein n=1 Tax=Aphanomyces astaci TaxID=112090 RepID=A0A397EG56_APHAT|nr:hypothetical protein DYB34_003004 [Aphanomyces astaci]RHY81692.1 hypothetical protein DYB31_012158 [Aphanomyces astaci]
MGAGLCDMICTHRSDLLERFEAADEAKSHVIPVSSWEHIMDDVLQVKLNWTIVRPLVTSTEPADPQAINYVEFLYRYQVRGLEIEDEHDGGQRVAEDTRKRRRDMFNNMYRYRKRLQALFQVFDQDGNGTINLDELKAGIEILNEHLPVGMKPFRHPEDLMKSLDFTHDNEININEFMECFRIHANLTAQAKWRHAKSKLKVMSALGMLKVVSDAPVVTASDVSFDKDDSESISPVVVMRTDGNDDSVVHVLVSSDKPATHRDNDSSSSSSEACHRQERSLLHATPTFVPSSRSATTCTCRTDGFTTKELLFKVVPFACSKSDGAQACQAMVTCLQKLQHQPLTTAELRLLYDTFRRVHNTSNACAKMYATRGIGLLRRWPPPICTD